MVYLKNEKQYGKHPTQKPLELMERILLCSTRENDLFLDPFNGSGTTGVASKKLNRRYIGFEIETEFLNITIERVKKLV
ncbi:site-specific DNA-methyltransferase [Mycoplasma anserisalpingitidis]|uniref:site-specific DNA-methyltransferase n=1 Tax=Mycoplasma anserisalpingitidis TaxID=519450 RepID=UPI00191DD239|nr:site-specific DNA-methyltransferase [Mycoplasma anserisalpingitidis]